MATRLIIRTQRTVLALLMAVGTLSAQQIPASACRQVWDGDRLVTVSTEGGRRVEVEERSDRARPGAPPRAPQVLAVPPGIHVRYAHQGTFYGHRFDRETRTAHLLRSRDGRRWEVFGRLAGGHRLLEFRHLEDGRVLLVAAVAPFQTEQGASPVALARVLETGEAQIDELVDLGLGAWERVPATRNQWRLKAPFLALETMGLWTQAFHLPGRVVLVDRWRGLFFVFDTERGRLQRTSQVFGLRPDQMEPEDEFCVLGLQPRPEGTLLVATREQGALLFARKDHPTPPVDGSPGWFRKARPAQADSLRSYPKVQWWTFHPDGAVFEAITAPEGLPSRLDSPEVLAGFRFRMGPDGSPRPEFRLVPRPGDPAPEER
ncbi:MAG TPA: hypothetical protein PKO12_07035 [Holophaga sp.]|nr:hypothetical protein [Holophaga sp.]